MPDFLLIYPLWEKREIRSLFWKVSIINSFASRCALTSHPYFIEQWFWLGSGHLYVHELKPVKGHYEYLQSIKCKYFADWSLNFEIALQCPTETQKSFRITCIHCCFEKKLFSWNVSRIQNNGATKLHTSVVWPTCDKAISLLSTETNLQVCQ